MSDHFMASSTGIFINEEVTSKETSRICETLSVGNLDKFYVGDWAWLPMGRKAIPSLCALGKPYIYGAWQIVGQSIVHRRVYTLIFEPVLLPLFLFVFILILNRK